MARRVEVNATYARTVRALAGTAPVKRLKTFKGPLPGIYVGTRRDKSG